MKQLRFSLFGRFNVQRNAQDLSGLEAQKVQELLCYILLYHECPHPRDKLSDLLWPKSSNTQAKQYLRQTLYQLQSALENNDAPEQALILVESDWIQFNVDASHWSDIAQFEEAFTLTQNRRGHELTADEASAIQVAVDLYRGDLLENWYQDWVILERERVQNLYLIMVDKLMIYCAAQQEYERGIAYGAAILRCDVAHERTYRRLMQLHALAGDRTGAIRQYDRCVSVLAQELGVEPAESTRSVYQQIKAGDSISPAFIISSPTPQQRDASVSFSALLDRLNHVRLDLINAQHQVEQDIELVKAALSKQL